MYTLIRAWSEKEGVQCRFPGPLQPLKKGGASATGLCSWYHEYAKGGQGLWHLSFDLDGTILDTTDLILKSFIHAFREGLGEDVSEDELITHFGRPLPVQFRTMRPQLAPQDIDKLVSIYREHNESQHNLRVDVVPGADRALRCLARKGYRLGIVTSKRQDMAERGLRLVGLQDLFDVIVHMDSTVRHKPHPEPVKHALALMRGDSSRAVYVGDSPYDMMAGHAAGLRTLGLVHNTFREETLRRAGADAVVFDWDSVVSTLTAWTTSETTVL